MRAMTLSNRQKNITLASVFTFAGVLYCLISLVNHYLFKTYTLDLGFYTHIMYDYAHFCIDDFSILNRAPRCVLSDHFDLYLMLLSPLVYVFGTYTLLVVQIVAVLLGGWGIYKLIGLYSDDDLMPIMATATFFFSFGIIQALAFDYHSNVLTAMMLPWLLYFIKQKRYGLASLFVILFVIGKENMSLWLFFVVTGLMWDYRKDKKTLWYLVGYAVFSMAYFFIINMVVMPALGGAGGGFSRYAHLGNSYVEIAGRLLSHPGEAIRLLFANTTDNPNYDGFKLDFYYCALASGMLLVLIKPNYFWMLIPLICQKMFASDWQFWGVSLQYAVEFMPVLIITSFIVIVKLRNKILQRGMAFALLISVILTTFYTIGVPKAYYYLQKAGFGADRVCVYQGRHYEQAQFDARYARELIRQIPDDASVCVSTVFVPHLALRDRIEDFAWTTNTLAEYVLITDSYFGYERDGKPIFGNRDEFEVVATDGTLYLFRRKQH